MSLFSRILLCYDATREGRRALRYGAELAQQLHADTHLLAVLESAHWLHGFDALAADALSIEERAAKEILSEGVSKLKASGVTATGHFAVGSPIDQIARVAHALKVDLIVVGHRRCGLLARWWAGPGHGLLLDRVSCSILVAIDPSDAEVPELAQSEASSQADAAGRAQHQ
ncbi:universal stress protein [Cupriavidus basilensis]|uniref:Universal stress protein n=1 Tax=Cupriavidus basilensis TaxID=68895 RepID=A0ABT6AH84_9BURK|nr:universal stress protein [Cupriavidus basilensis]MDF3831778.1 universal stress protein [Cupriavidus basilensis]